MNDEFDNLRRVSVADSDVDGVVADARTAFLAGLTAPKRTPAARTWSIGIGAGLVAAATVTAVVIAQQPSGSVQIAESTSPTATPSTTPSSAVTPTPSETPTAVPVPATLASIATSVASGAGDVPDGMFRKITTHSVMVLTAAGDGSGYIGHAPGEAKTAGIRVEQDVHAWIPADRFGVWVRESEPAVLTGTYGPDGEAYGAQYGVDGVGVRSESAGGWFHTDESMADWFAAAPRDPAALVAAERQRSAADGVASDRIDITVAEQLLDRISLCAAPSDLQSSMVSALATLGNVETLSSTPTSLTLRVAGSESLSQITLDATTGCAIERRTVFDTFGADWLPSDVYNGTVTTYMYEIVNSMD